MGFVEDEGSEGETYQYTAAAHHGNDGNEGFGLAQGVEIREVGCRQEEGDEQDAPSPLEGSALDWRLRLLAVLLPCHEQKDEAHHDGLILIVPPLHEQLVKPCPTLSCGRHKVFVKEATDGTEQGGTGQKAYPTVVGETDALALATPTEQEQREDGQQHTRPLPSIQTLAIDQKRTDQDKYGTAGVNRTYDGERQVLDGIVAAYPRGEHNHTLGGHKQMTVGIAQRNVEAIGSTERTRGTQQDKRQEDACTQEGIYPQNGKDGIASQRAFLADILEAEQGSGEKSKGEPHGKLDKFQRSICNLVSKEACDFLVSGAFQG